MAEIDCAASFAPPKKTKNQKNIFLAAHNVGFHRKICAYSQDNTSAAVYICSRRVCVSQQTPQCMLLFHSDSFETDVVKFTANLLTYKTHCVFVNAVSYPTLSSVKNTQYHTHYAERMQVEKGQNIRGT